MVRTQVQLTEERAATLRAMSAERRIPLAELIRMSVDSFLSREAGLNRDRKVARARAAAGRFASRLSDVSQEHDKYLAEAYGQR